MRFGFITCVRLGEACIREILRLGGDLALLVTLHDDLGRSKSGRVYLDNLARRHDIPLHKIRNVNDADAIELLREADLDWLFIIGWSQIAGPELLAVPRKGVLGMHPTLLPQGRGRASIPWAIIKGLEQTGVTLFKLDEGVDTGPILAQEICPLADNETASTLYSRVAEAHVALMRHAWQRLEDDTLPMLEQDASSATEWPGRRPEQGLIIPETMSVAEVDRLVRAVTHPYPGAFLETSDGDIVTIWEGHPAVGEPGPTVLRVGLTDGSYDAVSYERTA